MDELLKLFESYSSGLDCTFFWKKICACYFSNIPNSCSTRFKIILQHYMLYNVHAAEAYFQSQTLYQVRTPALT